MSARTTVAALLSLCLLSSIASAQATSPADDGFAPGQRPARHKARAQMMAQLDDRPGPPQQGERLGEQRKHLEQFRTLELLKLLDLEEDQEVAFLTAYKDLRTRQRQLEQERQELLEQLQTGLRSESFGDEKIHGIIVDILRLARQKVDLEEQFIEDARRTLSAGQLGKFVVFQEQFEFELLKKVRGFHQRGRTMAP